MRIRRVSLLISLGAILGLFIPLFTYTVVDAQNPQQQLVESVDIQGNRRLRDEDILYYVQTRPGDVFNQQQVERDLQAILALGFFDKTATRVLTEEGPRGGVNVIYEVKELPIIRDIQFEGLKSVPESDVLKAFREQRVGISKESIYDPVKARNAVRVIKELLASSGRPNASVEIREDEVSATSTAITFVVSEGDKVRIVEIDFEGNKIFGDGTLRSQLKLVKESGLISRFRGQDILDRAKLDYDLNNVRNYMRSKGYLQARTGEPRVEGLGKRRTGFFLPIPFLSSMDEALRVIVPITEGKLYRIGDIKIEGNSIYSEQAIQSVIGLRKGDIADGKRISDALFENLKKLYGSQGFIQYSAEPDPTFKDSPTNPEEGVVDFNVVIDEGKQFTLRRLEFLGNTFTRDNVLRREVLINEGEIYSQTTFEYSVLRLNQLGYFDPIDKDKDVDYRTDEESGNVDVNLKVVERGRQQISFNGGISGVGGSFFGLEYSTNNLLGRGETLSFNLAYGNRQRSFQFSFTEPYFRDRPITVGFSVFAFTQKFFGEGTSLSQNQDIQLAPFTPLGFEGVSDQNLFTRNSYGASIFASAPLSEFYRKRRFTQFSRVGASYSFSTTSVEDPEVNQLGDQQSFIPVIYTQPNIITSRITPSFVYDTRAFTRDANDPTSGKQITASLAFAGLGGDVRTYQPSISYTHFIPVRKKGTDRVEVFGFRIVAGNVGSFATSQKVRDSNSLSFVNGVPIFERYFLGDEFTIRGYNVRSISPIAPVDVFVTSRNVTVSTSPFDPRTPVEGLPASFVTALQQVGTFTGSSGSNPAKLGSTTFTSIGGDTQILGNFEYRIPLFGPASLAAFADVGTVFNLRKGSVQTINTNFLADQPFLSPFSLSLLALLNNPQLQGSPLGGLVIRDTRLVTREEFAQALEVGPVDPTTGLPFGMQQIFFRGEAQTNTLVSVGQSQFAKFTDIRSSVGLELRVQVPIVNVPFRLIYAYNPNARNGFYDSVPNFFFNEKKSVFRFSVGRTF
jgi:outer membrane protein insertion porin family